MALPAITMDSAVFRDAHGRHIILRGVNLGGDTKLPFLPDQRTHVVTDFADHRSVSFTGRPAPLDEIDAHLERIAAWGFNALRLLTTWEAVEHEGPGLYDDAYLDYYAEVCRRAGEHGLYVLVDFHQDVWSRMSGGSGAPGWTFEVAGLDFTKFDAADAANVMQYRYDPAIGGRQASYPVMSWPDNYQMPANGIMWTLFFGGRHFAPHLEAGGKNIQDFLQSHYLGAMAQVAQRVAELPNVIGFDTLNEPSMGYIGRGLSARMRRYRGLAWSPLDGLAVASGLSRVIPVMEQVDGGSDSKKSETVNSAGVSIWLPAFADPFRQAGAWAVGPDGGAVAVREDFFSMRDGHPIDAERDFLVPFFHAVSDTLRSIRPDWLLFAEMNPYHAMRGQGFPEGCPERTVNASHWYDMTSLVRKTFNPERMINLLSGEVLEGPRAIEDSYAAQFLHLKQAGERLGGGAPTFIGEFGIQYDMNDRASIRRWDDGERGDDIWHDQSMALELMYNALDRHLLSSAQWNYTATNSNDPKIGDGWNQEDLSIYSGDQQCSDAFVSGSRGLAGFCRPYVRAAQGQLVNQTYNRKARTFVAKIDANSGIDAPSEVYLPPHIFGTNPSFAVANAEALWHPERNILLVVATENGAVTIAAEGRAE